MQSHLRFVDGSLCCRQLTHREREREREREKGEREREKRKEGRKKEEKEGRSKEELSQLLKFLNVTRKTKNVEKWQIIPQSSLKHVLRNRCRCCVLIRKTANIYTPPTIFLDPISVPSYIFISDKNSNCFRGKYLSLPLNYRN